MYLIIVAVILSLIIALIIIRQVALENFSKGGQLGPCPNCGQRSKKQCFQCTDCGWCHTQYGYGECVPGNQLGPYFRKDCIGWQFDYTPVLDHPRDDPRWTRASSIWWKWLAPSSYLDWYRTRYAYRSPWHPYYRRYVR